MKEVLDEYKKHIIIAMIIIVALPIVINYVVIANNFASKADNSSWTSFFGSYLGGLIGGIGTLIAVLVTTRETRKIQAENNKNIAQKDYWQDVKRNKPMLIIKENDRGNSYLEGYRYSIARYDNNLLEIKNIVNVGIGLAMDVEAIVYNKKNGQPIVKKYHNVIEPKGCIKDFQIAFLDLSFYPIGELDYSKPIELRYKDIFNNDYSVKYDIGVRDIARNGSFECCIYIKSMVIHEYINKSNYEES